MKVLDKNGDGMIDVKELVNYLLREYSNTVVVHRLIRVLDSVSDAGRDRSHLHAKRAREPSS